MFAANYKKDLNDLEAVNQTAIIGSDKVMAAQFKERKPLVLTDIALWSCW